MPRLPLARTHRPQRFAEVLGQSAPVKALSAAAARREIASAYIFSGTRGIGKTTIARIFAKALNCEQGPAADCCAECTACREIAEGRCLDVLELDAATHTGIDDIRELRDAAQYPPARDRHRVFILDEAHQLSQSAWNGLLKILEEPPSWCVFLFCTTEPHKIPATIESRSLHFSFRSPSAAQIREHLARVARAESIEIEDEALDLLVQAADGSVRDGLSALDQVRALVDGPVTRGAVREALGLIPGEAVARFVESLAAGEPAAALAVIADLDEQGQDLRAFAAEALEQVRRLALVKTAGPDAAPRGAELGPLAARFRTEQLVWLGKVLDETESRLRQGGPTRALLDLAAVRMTSMANLPALAELAERLGGEPRSPSTAPPRGGPPADAAPRERRASPSSSTRPPVRSAAPPVAQDSGVAPVGLASVAPVGLASVAPVGLASVAPVGLASVAPPPVSGLLAQLAEAMEAIRPPAAAYLRSAQFAELAPDGVLRVSMPKDSIYAARLRQPATEAALLDAAQQATGQTVRRLEVVGGAVAAETEPPRPFSRQEVIARAKQDPLVKAIFEQFGAVVVSGHALGPDKEP